MAVMRGTMAWHGSYEGNYGMAVMRELWYGSYEGNYGMAVMRGTMAWQL